MTFIASVVAKEGIAVVSDSFVSTSEYSLLDKDLIKQLGIKKNKKFMAIKDVFSLFEPRTSSTRNYVDKLFKFDQFSAITTTGSAYINDKEVNDILKSISATMQLDQAAYQAKNIDEKLKEFIDLLKVDVLGQSKKRNFSGTRFLFSHYNVQENKPQIFVISIRSFKKDNFDETDPENITYDERTHLKIVSAGQDTFADRLIFGSFYTNVSAIKPEIVDTVNKVLKPKKGNRDKLQKAIYDPDFLREKVLKDVFAIELRELSLQEAVDLATLLLKIVMELQVYTEKIPTVGGVIRLAVIHKERGFEWIAGDKIIPPKII